MADKKQKREIRTTPKGVAKYPHLNKPDEYKGKRSYKVSLVLGAKESAGLRKYIDEQVDKAWDELLSEFKPPVRKKAEKYYPYEEEFDDNDEPTGNYVFKFSKNAEFKDKKTDEIIKVPMKLVDAKRNPMKENVWGGSILKVAFFCYPFANSGTKEIGVALKMEAAQIIDLVSGSGNSGADYFDDEEGFESNGADEDGFSDEEGYESEDNDNDDNDDDDGSGDF